MKSAPSTDFLKLHARLNQALNEKGFEIIKQQAYMIRPKAPGKTSARLARRALA